MRHSLTRVGVLAGAILAGVLLPLLPTASANAATCTYRYFCVWDYDNFEGTKKSWQGNNNNYANSGFDDRTQSLANNGAPATYDVVWFYDNPYYNADAGRGCVRRGEWIDIGWAWDNEISSHAWHSRCP